MAGMGLALYRKYRPANLGELLGQEANVRIFKNAARQNRIAHAYLFYGPRGTGKTSAARLIAKLANCERRAADAAFRGAGEPCNECGSCAAISANVSFDVIEIDAASNRGIDEIRNLKESVATAPARSAYKVYIIDEAHMLTGAASNALLKTLEEPPKHAIIILATTEYEKIPATITSRTQRFLFRKLSKKEILKKLASIVAAEKIAVTKSALDLIAAAAEGSMRDAESLLDQARSLEDAIDAAAIERITGRVGLKKVEALSELIVKRDLKGALELLEETSSEGGNPVQLARDLIHYLRKVASLKANPALEAMFASELTGEEVVALKKISEAADFGRVVKFVKSLIRAYSEMRYSPFASVPLEIAFIEELS